LAGNPTTAGAVPLPLHRGGNGKTATSLRYFHTGEAMRKSLRYCLVWKSFIQQKIMENRKNIRVVGGLEDGKNELSVFRCKFMQAVVELSKIMPVLGRRI
jgi:hypothetical protein